MRATQRDREAFGALYELYFERIYRYVRLKVSDISDAEDATAAVFLNAWRAVDSFTPQHEQSFLAWLFRLARNVLIDRYRRRREVTPLDAVDESLLPSDPRFDPEAALDWRLTMGDLA